MLAQLMLLAAVPAAMANGVLSANPPVANADLTTRGSDFLWAVFAIMFATALGTTVWGMMKPVGTRAFHWIGVAILFTASIAYFSMASNLGSTPVEVEFPRIKSDIWTGALTNGTYTRSVWYARYIDWTITTPLLLLELLLATGLPLSDIMITIFMDLFMVIGGLIGSLVTSSYKWGYFTGATIAMFFVFYQLIVPARSAAYAIGSDNGHAYIISTSVLLFLWLLYPIAWGLADGGNVISTDSEMIFYGILDVLAKPVFLFVHLFALRAVPYERFQLTSGHFSVGSTAGKPLLNEGAPRTSTSTAGSARA